MDDFVDGSEDLYRQIHPLQVTDSEPSSENFRPSPNDKGKLSVDRGSIHSAQESFDVNHERGLQSAGVFAFAVSDAISLQLICVPDPILPSPGDCGNSAHALVDFGEYKNTKYKNAAKRLKRIALERGCLYGPLYDSASASHSM